MDEKRKNVSRCQDSFSSSWCRVKRSRTVSESFTLSHPVLLFGCINACWFPFRVIYLWPAWCSVVLALWFSLAGKSAPSTQQSKISSEVSITSNAQRNWFSFWGIGDARHRGLKWEELLLLHRIHRNTNILPYEAILKEKGLISIWKGWKKEQGGSSLHFREQISNF